MNWEAREGGGAAADQPVWNTKQKKNETTAKTTRGHHTKSEGSHFWKKKKMTRLLTATIKMVSFLLFSAWFGALLGFRVRLLPLQQVSPGEGNNNFTAPECCSH